MTDIDIVMVTAETIEVSVEDEYYAVGVGAQGIDVTVYDAGLPGANGAGLPDPITPHELLIGAVGGSAAQLPVGLDNQLLVGQSAADPVWTDPGDVKTLLAITTSDVLGLGTAATHPVGDFAQVVNNLSDLANAATARTNLGLGSMAVLSSAGSGDVSGTWPSLTVVALRGHAVKNAAPSDGQILAWNTANADWEPVSVSADGTLSNTGAFTLAASGVTASTYGDGTHVAQVTVDAKGRVTAAANVTITGAAPTGSAGGDLGGSYPNPTVVALRGHTVKNAAPTDAQLLVWNDSNSDWEPVSLSADATITAAGVVTLKNTGPGATGPIGSSSAVPVITIDAKGRVTALSTAALGTAATLNIDTDTALAADSDVRIASQHAVKSYVDTAVTGLLDFKGAIDASTNPNYSAASKGDTYVVSVAGKVGGASGKSVDIGDMVLATADNAGGTEASVGTSWSVLEHNLVGALLASNNLSELTSQSSARSNLGLGNSAILNTGTASSQVVLGGVISAGGPTGAATTVPVITWNAAGQLTAVTTASVSGAGIDTTAVHTSDLPLVIGSGGTGQTTQQAALDALAGAVTNHSVLAGNGTHVTLRALTTADLPTGTDASSVVVGGTISGAGPIGDASHVAAVTYNAAGQLTTVSSVAIALAGSAITSGTVDIARLSTGTGASNVVLGGTITAGGPTGAAATVPVITYNAAGQLTAVTTASVAISAAAVTSGTLSVTRGGTGVSDPTAHAVYVGNGSSAMTSVGVGTGGQLLIGQGATSDPAWTSVTGDVTITSGGVTAIGSGKVTNTMLAGSIDLTSKVTGTLPVGNGGTGVANPTAHAVYVGAGSSAMASVGVGTAGQLLIGQSATTDPAWTTVGTDATIAANGALTIANSAVTLAKMANLADQRILGNNTGGSAAPVALTPANVMAMLSAQAGAAFDFNAQNVSNIGTLTNAGAVTLANAALGAKTASFNIATIASGSTLSQTTNTGLVFAALAIAPAFTFTSGTAGTFYGISAAPTVTMHTAQGAFGVLWAGFYDGAVVQGDTGAGSLMTGSIFSFYATPTIKVQDNNTHTLTAYTAFNANPLISNAGTLTITTLTQFNAAGVTVPSGTTITTFKALSVVAPANSGTITNWIGIDIAAVTAASTLNAGIRNASSLRQQGAFIGTVNTVTVASNAGTVAVTNFVSNFTNSSAANMTITMATSGAVDGQISIVRVYDATGVTKTITWVNTENGEGTVPASSNGSTTLPKTVMFMFNGATSLWRCIIV